MHYNFFALGSSFLGLLVSHIFEGVTYNIMMIKQDLYGTLIKVSDTKDCTSLPSYRLTIEEKGSMRRGVELCFK